MTTTHLQTKNRSSYKLQHEGATFLKTHFWMGAPTPCLRSWRLYPFKQTACSNEEILELIFSIFAKKLSFLFFRLGQTFKPCNKGFESNFRFLSGI